jgi:hypothetical protein
MSSGDGSEGETHRAVQGVECSGRENSLSICCWGIVRQGLKLIEVRRNETCCFLDGPVTFLKSSMEKVNILRKWVFGPTYALL